MLLPRLMVAPNGARLQKADHPALPINLDEIVQCAVDCYNVGADGLHLHLRDDDGGHLLDAEAYREALAELKQVVPELPIQITTEAVGQYSPEVQRNVALKSGANMVSVSIREICSDGESGVATFFEACDDMGIHVQHILYDQADAELLYRVLPKHLGMSPKLQLLFVLGRYSQTGNSQISDLTPFLEWMQIAQIDPDWAVCAFGKNETSCLLHAASNGGKCRIGFENSLYMADGTIATSNAEKVGELRKLVKKIENRSCK